MNENKRARLIKRSEMPERTPLSRKPAKRKPAKSVSAIQTSVEAVRGWIKEHQLSQQGQARQMFAALFAGATD
ncbi:MAG TPA: hypothetical protein VFD58_19885 [Blastocatellia bacterium]|nr:hypothetical protein [Blastocatellia bacterium]